MKIFKSKRVELVRDKACVEIEETANKVLQMIDDKTSFSFDVMQERDRLKNDNEILKCENKILKENNEKLYAYLSKVADILKGDHKDLITEIKDLKSDRYLIRKIKPTKETKTTMKIKSGEKNSAIIKKVKGDKDGKD